MQRRNITIKVADGHPCVMFMTYKVAGKHPGDAPTTSEPDVEAG